MAPLLLPICTNNNPMSGVWVYNAFGDPLLMSALLSHAAVHLDVVNQRPPSTLTLHYGMEATRQMNSRLDSGDLCLQDTSIAAVVMMLANQVYPLEKFNGAIVNKFLVPDSDEQPRGNADTSECARKNGPNERRVRFARNGWSVADVYRMVSRTCVSYSDTASNDVFRVDIPAAMFRNTKPRFTHSASPPRLADLMNRYVNFSCFDIEEFSRMDFTTSLFYLRQEIKNLAEIQSGLLVCPSRTSTAEAMEFAARRSSIEHVLLLAGQGYSTMYSENQDARLREVCCVAGSIYVNYVFRGSQPRVTITSKTLKRRLMTSVERLELEDQDRSDTVPSSIAALLWALCVGGTMAEDLEERTWFVLRLSTMTRRIGLKSWEQALSILNCFLWEEKLETDVWKEVWTDVEQSIVTGEVEDQ